MAKGTNDPKPMKAAGNPEVFKETDERPHFKKGGAAKKKEHKMHGGKSEGRLDKPHRANGGKVGSPFSSMHKGCKD